MDELEGEDAGNEAAALLADATGAAPRAVRPARAARLRDGPNPIHLASAQSLAEVNRALAAKRAAPVEMARFRPNVALAAAVGGRAARARPRSIGRARTEGPFTARA